MHHRCQTALKIRFFTENFAKEEREPTSANDWNGKQADKYNGGLSSGQKKNRKISGSFFVVSDKIGCFFIAAVKSGCQRSGQ